MSQRPIHIDLAPSDPANIRAQDDAFWLAGLLGATGNNISCILPVGNRFAISKTSNNEVVLQSGAYVMQGFVIEIPDSEAFSIASGAQGKKRLDLIVAEYKKGTPRSAYSLKVIQGTQGDDYIAPELTVQDLHAGGTTRQEKIAEVKIDGIDIVSQVITAITIRGISELAGLIVDHNHDTKYLGKTAKAADSDKLDGKDSTAFATAGHNHDSAYLGLSAKAVDSDKLDGKDSTEFATAAQGVLADNALQKGEAGIGDLKSGKITVHDNPNYQGDFVRLGLPEGGPYRFVSTYRYGDTDNWTQLSFPYSSADSEAFISFRTRNTSQGSGGSFSAWRRIYPVLFGTGAPPASLGPGQIYIQY